MRYLKSFNEAKEESLSSLQWEFWNQSKHTIENDSVEEFDKHVKVFKKDIDKKDCESQLKKIWNESRKTKSNDVKDNKDKFKKFIEKITK
jgi:hypothetical protein